MGGIFGNEQKGTASKSPKATVGEVILQLGLGQGAAGRLEGLDDAKGLTALASQIKVIRKDVL